MAEPLKITAGDTWSWTREGGDYKASAGWTLSYFFSPQGGSSAPVKVDASALGDMFQLTVAASASKDWTAGVYNWTARVTKAGETHTLGSGKLKVLPDPSTTATPLTHAERCLQSIEAALEKCFGDAIVEFEMDGLKVKKNRTELLSLRNQYRLEVRRERGQLSMRAIPVVLR